MVAIAAKPPPPPPPPPKPAKPANAKPATPKPVTARPAPQGAARGYEGASAATQKLRGAGPGNTNPTSPGPRTGGMFNPNADINTSRIDDLRKGQSVAQKIEATAKTAAVAVAEGARVIADAAQKVGGVIGSVFANIPKLF